MEREGNSWRWQSQDTLQRRRPYAHGRGKKDAAALLAGWWQQGPLNHPARVSIRAQPLCAIHAAPAPPSKPTALSPGTQPPGLGQHQRTDCMHPTPAPSSHPHTHACQSPTHQALNLLAWVSIRAQTLYAPHPSPLNAYPYPSKLTAHSPGTQSPGLGQHQSTGS